METTKRAQRIEDVLLQFHNSSCYPSPMEGEVDAAVERVERIIADEWRQEADEIATAIIKRICDLSEFSSPEDDPTLLLIREKDLRFIIVDQLTDPDGLPVADALLRARSKE